MSERTSDRPRILGIPLDKDLTMDRAVDLWLELGRSGQAHHAAFTNAHCANVAVKDPDYMAVLERTRLNLVDGAGMALAGKLLNRPIKDNVNGTDLFPPLLARLRNSDLGLYLLGAKPGVAEEVVEFINRDYPGVRVAGCHHGYFTAEEDEAVVEAINASGADILIVCMGVPNQEKWIDRHQARLKVGLISGMGALFDFYSGRIPRAPRWMREAGLEWLFRLMVEPRRMWKRYLVGNVVFLYHVVLEKLGLWGRA